MKSILLLSDRYLVSRFGYLFYSKCCGFFRNLPSFRLGGMYFFMVTPCMLLGEYGQFHGGLNSREVFNTFFGDVLFFLVSNLSGEVLKSYLRQSSLGVLPSLETEYGLLYPCPGSF